jgi:hypothetical protein
MTKYLNHELISAATSNHLNDMICINCSVRLERIRNRYDKSLTYDLIIGIHLTDVGILNYRLTCEEQQIKNLLE